MKKNPGDFKCPFFRNEKESQEFQGFFFLQETICGASRVFLGMKKNLGGFKSFFRNEKKSRWTQKCLFSEMRKKRFFFQERISEASTVFFRKEVRGFKEPFFQE